MDNTLEAQNERLVEALKELLDVAERTRGGDKNLDPERWFAIRDYVRILIRESELWPGADEDERDYSVETP